MKRVVTILLFLQCIFHNEVYTQNSLSSLTSADRPKIGLVLGGGGAKGAAEVGVLLALEEAGLQFDYITGTSIGSIIGALYSCGYRAKEIETLFLSQSWLKLLTDTGNRRSRRHRGRHSDSDGEGNQDEIDGIGLSRGEQVVELFDSLTRQSSDIEFDSLPIPFRCVATELRTQEQVILKSGSLPLAMRASMSIPGMFKPVHLNGQTLVDGGMQNNLPVDVVKDMGAEYVIAIDLSQAKHTPRNFSLKETFGIGGILDWVVSRPDWSQHEANVKATDLYIKPDLNGYDAMDFQKEKIEKMIAIGYATAKQVLSEKF